LFFFGFWLVMFWTITSKTGKPWFANLLSAGLVLFPFLYIAGILLRNSARKAGASLPGKPKPAKRIA
jgi:hypothetical protein